MKLGERKLFYGEFLRDAPRVGSVTPSSRRLARAVISEMQNVNGSYRILEAGAGTGVVTREILRAMRVEDVLDIYELNSRFAAHLRATIIGNGHIGRVRLFEEDVLQIPEEGRYDHIICGIPVNNMPAGRVQEMFETFFSRLAPGGRVSFYEYIGSRPLQMMVVGRTGRRRLKEIGQYMRGLLDRHEYRRVAVLRNLPPAFAHHLSAPNGSRGTNGSRPAL